MTEIERILDQLRRAYEGEAWHGPSVREVLAGVTAEQARERPLANAHSIWELVHHIAVWESVGRRRLEGPLQSLWCNGWRYRPVYGTDRPAVSA